MYKKILVPLDGSQRAEEILEYVEYLANRFRSEVILLRVDSEPLMLGVDEVIDQATYQNEKQRKDQLEFYLTGISNRFRKKGIPAKNCIASGSVVGTILNVAKKEDVDLIALASHYLGKPYKIVCKSFAERLLQRTDRSILVIRRSNDAVVC